MRRGRSRVFSRGGGGGGYGKKRGGVNLGWVSIM